MQDAPVHPLGADRHAAPWALQARRFALAALVIAAVIASAIVAKESRSRGVPTMTRTAVVDQAGAAVDASRALPSAAGPADAPPPRPGENVVRVADRLAPQPREPLGPPLPDDEEDARFVPDPEVRWFAGRPVRPARVLWMTVTAYSPDARSCGDSADGITATLHSVTTNASRLVAADPTVLPYGSMLAVPGYGGESIVPVLDCGSAIKGHRLDVLFPTHEEALRWGVRLLPVTVYDYADGLPPDNPRKER